jgi:hypothetical protein
MEPNNLYVLLVLCMLQKQKKLHIHTLKYQDTTIHETIHELHRRKKSAIILKIDFEKPYDKVKWPFIKLVLQIKGFSVQWCQWIDKIIQGVMSGLKLMIKWVLIFRQKRVETEDPLSPLLFNIVADMLAILIKKAKVEGQFDVVVSYLVDDGLSILQYADDTIIFGPWPGESQEIKGSVVCVRKIVWT